MRTVHLGFAACLLLAASIASAQQAPFCLVSNDGLRQCFYYSLDACRQAAATLGGLCAASSSGRNLSRPAAPAYVQQFNLLDATRQVQEAGDAGRREGERRREARLRAELLEAQIERERAAVAAPVQGHQSPGTSTLYKCLGANGTVFYTGTRTDDGCVAVTTFRPEQVPPVPPAPAPVAAPRDFGGYACTQDCSGHEAGYEWAAENGIQDPAQCGGNSQSFIEGCQDYAERQQEEAYVTEDGDECDPEYEDDCLPEDDW